MCGTIRHGPTAGGMLSVNAARNHPSLIGRYSRCRKRPKGKRLGVHRCFGAVRNGKQGVRSSYGSQRLDIGPWERHHAKTCGALQGTSARREDCPLPTAGWRDGYAAKSLLDMEISSVEVDRKTLSSSWLRSMYAKRELRATTSRGSCARLQRCMRSLNPSILCYGFSI
jgi:hypothetical protein